MGTCIGPNLITTGLVFELDAGNINSYSGTTSWNDISGNSNNGTLTNGPKYSPFNGGNIVFDGTNDYVTGTNASSVQITGNLTLSAWVVLGDSTYQGIISKMFANPYNGYGLVKVGGYFAFWTASSNTYTYTNSDVTYTSNNNWFHVVGVRTAGVNRIFINGVKQIDSQSPSLSDSGDAFVIGRYYSNYNDYYASGKIAFASIQNIALTDAEVLQNYTATRGRYDSTTLVSSGLVLNLDAGNMVSYPGSGTTWTDLSENNNTGTLTNGPTYSSSNGGVIVFDGTNDYIATSSNQNLLPTAGLSICAWIKTSVADKWGVDKAPSAGGQGYIFAGTSLSTWAMNVNGASVQSVSTYTSNTWKFIVGTWTPSSNLKIYFNGVLDAISTTSIPATITDPSVNLWIARRRSGGDYFNGSIANVSIYSVALTDAQVLQNYNVLRGRFDPLPIVTLGLILNLDAGNIASYPGSGTTWTDLSGNNNTGTLTNGPTYSSSNGGALVFDGTNDYVTCGISSSINAASTSLTWSCWFKSNSISTEQLLFSNVNATATNGFQIEIYQSKMIMAVYPAGTYAFANTTLSSNTWYHLCVTYSSGTITYYLNGVNDGTTSRTFTVSTGPTYISSWAYSAGYFINGHVSSVLFYNTALTAAQVLQNFNALRGRFGL